MSINSPRLHLIYQPDDPHQPTYSHDFELDFLFSINIKEFGFFSLCQISIFVCGFFGVGC